MPRKTPKIPPYSLHKATGQAYALVKGVRVYLGAYETSESRARYAKLVAGLDEAPRKPVDDSLPLTVNELLAAFLEDAESRFRKPDGSFAGAMHNYKAVMKRLKEAYGNTAAADFKALRLIAFRESMIRDGLTRRTINTNTHLTRAIWRFGVSRELVSEAVYVSLQSVKGLERGRYGLKDNPKVQPVNIEHVNAIKDYVSRQVWALIQVQLSSGARAGELVGLRPMDIDMTRDDVWAVNLEDHKAAKFHERRIYIGPRGMAAIRPFLAGRAIDVPLFSPAEAEAERLAKRHAKRVTPESCGNTPGSNKAIGPKRTAGAAYTTCSYRRCITRACEEAGIPAWHPHQIRHLVATTIRKEADLETAATVLGHAEIDIAEVYAERNSEKARAIVAKVG